MIWMRSIFITMSVLVAGLLASTFMWLSYDVSRFIAVSEIRIHDTFEGEPIIIEVDRELFGDWWGGYDVTVRNIKTGVEFCRTGLVQLEYQQRGEKGELVKLPDPVTLGWWAYGGSCTTRLASGLPPGWYSVKTCHWVMNPYYIFPAKRKCWSPTSVFSVKRRIVPSGAERSCGDPFETFGRNYPLESSPSSAELSRSED